MTREEGASFCGICGHSRRKRRRLLQEGEEEEEAVVRCSRCLVCSHLRCLRLTPERLPPPLAGASSPWTCSLCLAKIEEYQLSLHANMFNKKIDRSFSCLYCDVATSRRCPKQLHVMRMTCGMWVHSICFLNCNEHKCTITQQGLVGEDMSHADMYTDWEVGMIVKMSRGEHMGRYGVIVAPPRGAEGKALIRLRESSGSSASAGNEVNNPITLDCAASGAHLAKPRRKDLVMVLAGSLKGHVGVVKAVLPTGVMGTEEVVLDNLPMDVIPLSNVVWLHERPKRNTNDYNSRHAMPSPGKTRSLCCYCGEGGEGVVKCCETDCDKVFHVPCGVAKPGCTVDTVLPGEELSDGDGDDDTRLIIRCHLHTETTPDTQLSPGRKEYDETISVSPDNIERELVESYGPLSAPNIAAANVANCSGCGVMGKFLMSQLTEHRVAAQMGAGGREEHCGWFSVNPRYSATWSNSVDVLDPGDEKEGGYLLDDVTKVVVPRLIDIPQVVVPQPIDIPKVVVPQPIDIPKVVVPQPIDIPKVVVPQPIDIPKVVVPRARDNSDDRSPVSEIGEEREATSSGPEKGGVSVQVRWRAVAGGSSEIGRETLVRLFSPFGVIDRVGMAEDSATIYYSNSSSAERAVAERNNFTHKERGGSSFHLRVGQQGVVRVSGLDVEDSPAMKATLQREFGRYGSIKHIEIFAGKGEALLTYQKLSSAQYAAKAMHRKKMAGSGTRSTADGLDVCVMDEEPQESSNSSTTASATTTTTVGTIDVFIDRSGDDSLLQVSNQEVSNQEERLTGQVVGKGKDEMGSSHFSNNTKRDEHQEASGVCGQVLSSSSRLLGITSSQAALEVPTTVFSQLPPPRVRGPPNNDPSAPPAKKQRPASRPPTYLSLKSEMNLDRSLRRTAAGKTSSASRVVARQQRSNAVAQSVRGSNSKISARMERPQAGAGQLHQHHHDRRSIGLSGPTSKNMARTQVEALSFQTMSRENGDGDSVDNFKKAAARDPRKRKLLGS